MLRSRMSIALAIAAVARIAAAQPDPAFDKLERALPPGWSLLATGSELVIRHDRPCYVTGVRHDNAPATEVRTPAPEGPVVTIELRYRLEPRWTAAQIAAAKAANDKLGAEFRALAARYDIDAIHKSKGRPLPATADERARLSAYDAEHARLSRRLVKLPRCHLGAASVFDGEDTYSQLGLEVDPPEAITQAHRIIEIMKQYCAP